jgi:hypothetical protein
MEMWFVAKECFDIEKRALPRSHAFPDRLSTFLGRRSILSGISSQPTPLQSFAKKTSKET